MLTSGSMTAAIDRLEAKGLVRRDADPTDARARVIELTAEGRALIAPIFADHEERLDRAVAAVDPADRAELLRLLRTLRAGIREMPSDHDH